MFKISRSEKNLEEIDKSFFNRKEFICKAITVPLSAGIGLSCFSLLGNKTKNLTSQVFSGNNLLRINILGKTGLKVSSMSMGQGMEPSVYLYAYDRGMNLIESARGYRGGSHEKVVAQALKRIKRDKVYIVTKIDSSFLKNDDFYNGIIKSTNLSLQALETDYIDILLGHGIDEVKVLSNPSFQKAFIDLKKSGKIRFCGVSTHKARPILEWMIHNPFYDVAMIGFNYASPFESVDILLRAKQSGIGILNMKTLALNLKDRKKSLPAALRYVLSRNFIDSAVVLMANFTQLKENLKTLESQFSESDLQLLKENIRPSRSYF